MAAKRRSNQKPRSGDRSSSLSVRRRANGQGWELVHPRCAAERAEDLEEVAAMIEAGELEIAAEELRWLLDGCHDCLAAHLLLGQIAATADDWALARGHFGYAWELGLKAIDRGGARGPLPYSAPANVAFLEAGRGVAHCLQQLGQPGVAVEVLEALVAFDPADPLECRAMLAAARQTATTGRGLRLPVIQPPAND